MSVGNLKDQGNKGNNFPYQLRNLQLLGAIQDCCAATGLLLAEVIALLTTIDADTSKLDINLSTRASELTLSTLNSKFVNGTDIGDVTINNGNGTNAVNIQDGGNSITVDGGVGVQRTVTFLRPSGTNGTISAGAYSVSFVSVGTANALIGGQIFKPGEDAKIDAGAINNTLGAITYDTSTNVGAELLIIILT